MSIDVDAVLRYARDLQRANSFHELLATTAATVQKEVGYSSCWVAAVDSDITPPVLRILAVSGAAEQIVWSNCPIVPIEGDQMVQEILVSTRPVVVIDARTDPRTNKEIVAAVGNRTIINAPMVLGDERLGMLGVGTLAPEEPRPPTADQLERLAVFATQLAGAFQRVRLQDTQRVAAQEQAELRNGLIASQRLESLALLSGGIAHDFNNLLCVIDNNLRFLADGTLDPQQRRDVDDALAAALRARALTRQLLALGRRQALRLEQTDWNARLSEMLALLRRLIPETVRIEFTPAPGLPSLTADPDQLDQVVMNLCINARDAMPAGGTLRLATSLVEVETTRVLSHRRLAPGRYLLLTVRDDGEGIAAEVRERIFEPFFTTKALGVGSGMGLAVTAGIIERHEGLLDLETAPGKGTTFFVYLPLRSAAAPATLAAHKRQSAGREHILIAEDEPAVAAVTRRILEGAGYVVEVVGDGPAAVAATGMSHFHLLLLDAVMPGLSGRGVWERVRGQRPDLAFLFCSGYAPDLPSAQALHQAGVEMLEKPFSPDELLSAVRRALERRAGG